MPKSGYRDCQRLHRLTKILWLIKPTRSVQSPFYAARGSSVEKISTSAGMKKCHVTASDRTLYTGKKKHRGTDTTMFLYFYSMYHSRPDTLETNNWYRNVWDIFHILVTDCDLCQHNVRSTATKVFADTNNKYLKIQEAGKCDVGFEYRINRIPQKCLTQKAIVALNDRWTHITNRAPTLGDQHHNSRVIF